MIKSKEDLYVFLKIDNCNHWERKTARLNLFYRQDEFYYISKYLKLLRKQEFYVNNIKNNKIFIIFYLF